MSVLNWKAIQQDAIHAASLLGHTLGRFQLQPQGMTSSRFMMASCENCHGCCWVAHTHRGFSSGGRLLKFRCGTPEAAGFLRRPAQ